MFLAKAGEYQACGIFSTQHFILIAVTIIGIIIALKYTIKKDVNKIIKNCTIFITISELIIILYKIITGGITNLENYLPLYYCSLLLHAGRMSCFGKGKLKRAGDVFLATGGIVGGIIFVLYPSTSLPTYPMLHMVSIHSFIFHGIMIYLGLLVNITNYIELKRKDIIYYFSIVGIMCMIALIINNIFNTNFMFISKNFPDTPVEILYNLTGKFFTPVAILGQSILPFYVVYGIRKLVMKKKAN